MRRTMTGMTLCAAVAVLLTGCGSEDPKPAADNAKPAASQSPRPRLPRPAAGPTR